MQTALITGASSGIGLELAKIMAAKGHNLILVSRSLEQLNNVKTELTAKNNINIKTVAADLSEPGAALKLYNKLSSDNVEILINNAGVGLKGDFFSEDLARNTAMAQLNMISLMELSQLFGKDFKKNKKGKILNVASIAAFFPGPKQPVYYATKAFVRNFSRALAYNLKDHGVTVTLLHPGATRTDFFNKADAPSFKRGASAASVAALGYKAMMNGKIEVTNGFRNKLITSVLTRITPYNLQPLIIDKASEI